MPEVYCQMRKEVIGKGIIWGGNYYQLKPSRGYLIWDKMQSGFSLADSEFAWVSEPITPKTYRIEKEPEYFEIACKRISDAESQGNLFGRERTKPEQIELPLAV